MTTIVCTSDLHEHLVEVPACDLLLIAGDVSFALRGDLAAKHAFPSRRVQALAGPGAGRRRSGAPRGSHGSTTGRSTPRAATESSPRVEVRAIPAGTDVVVAHGPPHGFGNGTSRQGRHAHVGSTAMTAALERVQPRVTVRGHIHPAYGRYRLGETEIINASLVDESCRPVNPVVEIEL